MKSFIPIVAAALAVSFAQPGLGQRHSSPISMQVARDRALAVVPRGRVRSVELEREHGRLIYSFDITVPGRAGVEEVQISALTGRLISRRHESAAAELRERQAEARAHRRRRN
ncbi:MAG TPA: PepSY domain-containing protein [Allosphingosinicella sp.]|jgi:uncharacterized membrane protein YkoI|nr:PepSY domain-containing protein [Allosphingosinicella sp.]